MEKKAAAEREKARLIVLASQNEIGYQEYETLFYTKEESDEIF